jgi:hypothetical protein
MPNIIESGAIWLGGQLTNLLIAGKECVYRRGADVIDINLVPRRHDPTTDRNALTSDREIAARTSDWIGVASDFVLGDVLITPQPGDEIDWTDVDGEPRTSVVVPMVGEHCFRFHDPSKKLFRIFSADSASFVQLTVRTPTAEFTVTGLISRTQGREVFTDYENTTKLSQITAYIERGQFEANSIFSLPVWISVDALGHTGWSVNLSESAWGEELVKLGLEREELAREYQARRNAQGS